MFHKFKRLGFFYENKPDFIFAHHRRAVLLQYVGEEKRNKNATRRYEIDGKGLKNRGGFIRVNEAKNYFEDVEIDLADNSERASFKFKLLKTEK